MPKISKLDQLTMEPGVNPLIEHLLKQVAKGPIPDISSGPDILAESRAGLAIPLTPVQRLILGMVGTSWGCGKAHKFLDDEHTRKIFKKLCCNGNTLIDGWGVASLWLPPGTDIKLTDDTPHINFKSPINLVLCIAGRRSGKTTISAVLMAWLARKFLHDPHYLDNIPILKDSIVSILNVACDTNQARILYGMLIDDLAKLGLIRGKTNTSGATKTGRLSIESLSSSSRSARGRTACGVAFDEFAHFQRSGGPLSDRAIWKALLPSLATFNTKSLAVITTSPAGRSGMVWDLFTHRGERDGMLTIQLPTWVMNPHIPRTMLDGEYAVDENLARQEYGGEFLAPDGRFLDEAQILACVREPKHPEPGKVYRHIHVDLGLRNDATAIALGYRNPGSGVEDMDIVIQDVITMKAASGEALNVSEIEKKISELATRWEVGAITFDQHQSAYLIERLNSRGFDARVFSATEKSNREVFSYFRFLVSDFRIIFPSHPQLIDELIALQCTPTATGFRVDAPWGKHDDCVDAVASCAWFLAHGELTRCRWLDMLNLIEAEW